MHPSKIGFEKLNSIQKGCLLKIELSEKNNPYNRVQEELASRVLIKRGEGTGTSPAIYKITNNSYLYMSDVSSSTFK